MKAMQRNLCFVALVGLICAVALGNGGPFVVKYPSGDPAAKGILARLEPDLKPGTITDLRVVKEDLSIEFGSERMTFREVDRVPLVNVTAAYTIENPTDKPITIDFGFPVMRGLYIHPYSMVARPMIHARVNDKMLPSRVISNSMIYGIIRRDAHKTIEAAIEADAQLAKLVGAVRVAPEADRAAPRKALEQHAINGLKWKDRDAALLVEYASVRVTPTEKPGPARSAFPEMDQAEERALIYETPWLITAIGEQKATQFMAHLANCFNPKAAGGYEAIFSAWGGDVREQSVDLKTGKVRPREIVIDPNAKPVRRSSTDDYSTVYARVDYINENAKLSEPQKDSCRKILKEMPVVFTFAPMNLLHYQTTFAPKSTVVLAVSYTQHAYRDTADPGSYQIAYVLHPASMWKDFGPINLRVSAPADVKVQGSVALAAGATDERNINTLGIRPENVRYATHTAVLKEKTGELFIGIDGASWDKLVPAKP